MSYRITAGLPEDQLPRWLEKAAKEYGVFDDGRINYKEADTAPIILCVVACEKEFLLLKRGYGLADAEGYWSVVTGFIDAVKPIKQQIIQEIHEETGLSVEESVITTGKSYTLENSQEKRQYIIFPSIVRLTSKPHIRLDHEHTDQTWITKSELASFHILDDLPYALDVALGL